MEIILKDRVYNYIRQKEKGVSIAELEKEFGKTRMRLGYVISKLEEERKIMKANGSYHNKPP